MLKATGNRTQSRPFILLLAEPVEIRLPAALHPDKVEGRLDSKQWAQRMLTTGAAGITYEGPTP
jgi:hypothetical protein